MPAIATNIGTKVWGKTSNNNSLRGYLVSLYGSVKKVQDAIY